MPFIFCFHQSFLFFSWDLLIPFPAEEFRVDDNTRYSWRCFQGCILDITSFVSKNCTEQFLFRSWVCLPFWCNLSYQDVAMIYFGTYTYNTSFIEIARSLFTHIGDLSGELFLTPLCIPDLLFKFRDVDRRSEERRVGKECSSLRVAVH